MDLGSLELQIFVSLTVVLGAAFVALVCDYLKGNNEQLREHNIELRVRKEEQERRLLLDPAGFLGQFLPGATDANRQSTPATRQARTVSAHEVMQSFAAPEALREAETRAAKFHARGGDESFDATEVPPLTQRRGGRSRRARNGNRDNRANGESYADWVRPEIIARVARKSEAAAAYGSDIRDEIESVREEVQPEPLNAAENWDIRDKIPVREKQARPAAHKANTPPQHVTPERIESPVEAEPEFETVTAEARMNPEDANRLQQEIERVAQLERVPVAPAPGTILRPLTVPSLKLQDEIQRVAEQPSASVTIAAMWHSPLLDEIIAASAARGERPLKPTLIERGAASPPVSEVVAEESPALPRSVLAASAKAPHVALALVAETESVLDREQRALTANLKTIIQLEPAAPQVAVQGDISAPQQFEFVTDEEVLSEGAEVSALTLDATSASSKPVERSPILLTAETDSLPSVFDEGLPAVREDQFDLPAFSFVMDDETTPAASETAVLEGDLGLPVDGSGASETAEFSLPAESQMPASVQTEQPLLDTAVPTEYAAEPEHRNENSGDIQPAHVIVAAEDLNAPALVSVESPSFAFIADVKSSSEAVAEMGMEVEPALVSEVSLAVAPISSAVFAEELSAAAISIAEFSSFTFGADVEAVAATEIEVEPALAGEKSGAPTTVSSAVFAEKLPPPANAIAEFSSFTFGVDVEAVAATEIEVEPALASEKSGTVGSVSPAVAPAELPAPVLAIAEFPSSSFTADTESASEAVAAAKIDVEPALPSEVSYSVDPLSAAAAEELPALADVQAEPTPISFTIEVSPAPATLAAAGVEFDQAIQDEDPGAVAPPPFVFVLDDESPAMDEKPDLLADVRFETAEAHKPPPVYSSDDLELSLEPVAEPAVSIDPEIPSFWLEPAPAASEMEIAEPAQAPGIFNYYAFSPQHSRLDGMAIPPAVDYLPPLPPIEKPAPIFVFSEAPALVDAEPKLSVESALDELPALLPLYSEMSWEPTPATEGSVASNETEAEPPPFWAEVPASLPETTPVAALPSPIDISVARQPEPTMASLPPAVAIPELLLPTGMHDLSTWTRLLSLPNPMTGILFVITLQPNEGSPVVDRKNEASLTDSGPAVEKLMASFVREGDFGTRTTENEWIFVYNHDVSGFNQRRVGMISEKLWDFQLRHLGMANVNFKWGAVDVKSEGLGEAVQAARDRMNQTRRSRKLPGADHAAPRRAVNA